MQKVFLTLTLFFLLLGLCTVKISAQENRKGYIVVFKDTVTDPQTFTTELGKKHGFAPDFIYKKTLKGFAAKFNVEQLDKVNRDPQVAFISEDGEVTYQVKEESVPKNNGKRPRPLPTQPIQTVPSGISRIGLNALNEGADIGVAVIDTGIELSHPDLSSKVIANTSCVTGAPTGNDDNGHGTHVAGTIAGANNSIGVIGVAPQAKLVAVKVLNAQGSGSWSSVICGIDWVTSHASEFNIKVANMSLGGSGSSDNNCGNINGDALHKAICNSTKTAGVTYVVAAGNNNSNSSTFVPAAYNDTLITVSALADSDGKSNGEGGATAYGPDDTFATFSNYGSVVDLAGPGVSIYSTYLGGGYATLSGTSMATPHVTGAAALYLKTNPTSSWSQVISGLKAVGESKGAGHTDPSGLHNEPVVKATGL